MLVKIALSMKSMKIILIKKLFCWPFVNNLFNLIIISVYITKRYLIKYNYYSLIINCRLL